ncbi:MAG TPA: dihydrodipicolinate synthase family protein [Streptosporangiaceae bacterium]|nr:dihydrodipicolinate synthase family protein [Streptosporangiaceae bacterium]
MSLDPVTAERLKSVLATVVAIPVTPFDDVGQVDWDAHARVVGRLVEGGVTVVTPNGNTGEFYTLTPDEARRVTESAIKTVNAAAAGSRAEVLAGVGLDTVTAIDAARHAAGAGASMIMIHQPVHPYVSAEGWLEYHQAIAAAVPDTGVVLYIKDTRIGGELIGRLGESCPNVIGVKYGVRDPVLFAAAARDAGAGRFTWLAGLAELTAPGLWAVGAQGFTSGLVNVAPAIPAAMLGALRRGDTEAAMTTWDAIRAFEELRGADSSADNVSVVKEALAQIGVCGRAVRPPSRLLPGPAREQIAAILAAWGLDRTEATA